MNLTFIIPAAISTLCGRTAEDPVAHTDVREFQIVFPTKLVSLPVRRTVQVLIPKEEL